MQTVSGLLCHYLEEEESEHRHWSSMKNAGQPQHEETNCPQLCLVLTPPSVLILMNLKEDFL